MRVAAYLASGQAVLAGVARYAALHGPWLLLTRPRGAFWPLPEDLPFEGDGMIVHAGVADLEAGVGLAVPTVNIGTLIEAVALPSVIPDNVAVGRAAAEHLADRGCTHLGFCGFAGHGYSDARLRGVAEVVRERGLELSLYPEAERSEPERGSSAFLELETHNLANWLKSLPRPTGVVCCNDMRGNQLLTAARQGDVAVPDQVAIVGADNDELVCEAAYPPLSSVAIPFEQIGYEAAAMLDGMMGGSGLRPQNQVLAPLGVIARASSDMTAVADADVVRALRFIREHATEQITVDDVVSAALTGRRSLERRFRELLKTTIQQQITRQRIEKAKQLLRLTDWSMPKVAQRSGFPNAERLSVIFRRETGQTPTGFRGRDRGA